MKPVWITGAGGLIGSHLVVEAQRREAWARVVPLIRRDLELTDFESLGRRFRAERPWAVIHTAGCTRGTLCEADPEKANVLNVDVSRNLADLALETGATLVFLSTDLVFDGAVGGYREDDEPKPMGVYARTKREGEKAVLTVPGHIVVRTALNYGISPTGDRSFHEDMLKAVREGRRLKLFVDEYRCPIPSEGAARAIWDLVERLQATAIADRPAGVYHLAGTERLSRWEIGELLTELHPEFEGMLEASSIRDYRGPARPADVSLRCDRIRPWLKQDLPAFSEWVRRRRQASDVSRRGS